MLHACSCPHDGGPGPPASRRAPSRGRSRNPLRRSRGHRQIFDLNLLTGELLQITTATDGDSVRPSMNEHAQIITFESTASLKGAGSGVPQVFAFLRTAVQRVPANVVLQITNGTGPSTRPMMNAFSRLVFQSTSDLLGDGHDTGISQIFMAQ